MPVGALLAASGLASGAAGAAGAGAAGAGAGASGAAGGISKLAGMGGGSGSGGGIGSKIGGLVKNAGGLGKIAQTGFAVGQMVAGAINRRKAEAMLPPSENPMERQLLNTVRRRRRALETGTAATADRSAIKQMARQYGQGAFRAGGQVNTGILAQLLNQGMANISSQYGQQVGQTLGMEQEQVSKMADVSRDLALLRSARKSAQAENQMQAGQQNLLASLGGGKFYGQQG